MEMTPRQRWMALLEGKTPDRIPTDYQRTLPFGTVEDVVREVRESVRIYRDARWICAPCHNLQPVSPTENIVAMYETIHAFGGG